MVYGEGALIIRFFTNNDINQIASLHSRYLNNIINDSVYKYNLMYYNTVLYHQDNICLVAVRPNELVGYIFLKKLNHNELFDMITKYPFKILNILKIAVLKNKYIFNIFYKVILSTVKNLLFGNNLIVNSNNADYYHISPIVVKEDYWGTNVATNLLLMAEKILMAKKERKLVLYVNIDNKRAINFYEKMNFKIVNDINEYKMITMEKIITNDKL